MNDLPTTGFDCRTCAACCSPEVRLPFYVGLRASDLVRLEPRFRARYTTHASLLTKLDPVGRCVCVALAGTVGKRASCRIYERRPEACRELQAGGEECIRARQQAGLEPPDVDDDDDSLLGD